MTNILEFLGAAGSDSPAGLREVRLSGEPATVIAFTPDGEDVMLHYESSDEVRGYLVCPGVGCPLCYLGSQPAKHILLPVYNIETASIEFLRVPLRFAVGSLGSAIVTILKRTDLLTSVVTIRRVQTRYEATVSPLPQGVDNGRAAINAFIDAHTNGLKLSSAFQQPTAVEIASFDRVRRKLDAVPGWTPPPSSPPPAGSESQAPLFPPPKR